MLASWRTSCWCRQDEETGPLTLNRQVNQTNCFPLSIKQISFYYYFNSFLKELYIQNVGRSIMEAGKGSFLLWPPPSTDRKPRLAWCAALWHHFLHLWGKCFCCEVWGPPAELLGLPWQLEDIQLLCFPLLNSIQIPPKNGPTAQTLAQTTVPVLPLCFSFSPFPFCSMLLCPLSWELQTCVCIISVWRFASCSGAFLYIETMVKNTFLWHRILHRFLCASFFFPMLSVE